MLLYYCRWPLGIHTLAYAEDAESLFYLLTEQAPAKYGCTP